MATVTWKINPREPVGPPNRYQRWLHELEQLGNHGPDGEPSPSYYLVVWRDEQGHLHAELTRPTDDSAEVAYVALLDAPADTPSWSIAGADAASRPNAPLGPTAASRAIRAGGHAA